MAINKRFREEQLFPLLLDAQFKPNYTNIAKASNVSVSTIYGIWHRMMEEGRVRVTVKVQAYNKRKWETVRSE